ncbi:6841_t:CDS:1, partial [Entrophospora sp. SA101]
VKVAPEPQVNSEILREMTLKSKTYSIKTHENEFNEFVKPNRLEI